MTYRIVGRALCVAVAASALSAGNLYALSPSESTAPSAASINTRSEHAGAQQPARDSSTSSTSLSVPETSVSLAQALSRTLSNNPALATFPYRLRAADADVLQASARPAPTLSVEIENVAGNAPYGGFDGAQVTLALSQMIEMGSKRQQRGSVASLGVENERLAYETARLDTLGETLRRYVELAQAEAGVALAQTTTVLAREARQAAARRVKAGAAPRSDVTRLIISEQQAELSLRRAQLQRHGASARLAVMWGEGAVETLRPTSALTPLPALPSLTAVRARLQQSPALLTLATQTRLREAQLRLVEANSRADMTLSVGARRDFLSDGNSMVMGFSMPLGAGRANRGNESRARAALSLSEAEKAAADIEILALIDDIYRSLQITREELNLVEQKSLPLMRELYQDIERGYRAGRYSLLELINAQQEQLALEQGAIALAAKFHIQRNELERLTGQTFFSAGDEEIQ